MLDKLKKLFPRMETLKYTIVGSDYVKRSLLTKDEEGNYYIVLSNRLSEKEKEEEVLDKVLDMLLPSGTENYKHKVSLVKADLLYLVNKFKELRVGDKVHSLEEKGEIKMCKEYRISRIMIDGEGKHVEVISACGCYREILKEGEYEII